jgi:hypothetical protein
MVYKNDKSKRRFIFEAPYNEEGADVVSVPFPAACVRKVKGGEIIHDCNPAVVEVVSIADGDVMVITPTGVQPCSMVIIVNKGDFDAVVSGVTCPAGERTLLMYDGEGYRQIGAPPKSTETTETTETAETGEPTETAETTEPTPEPAKKSKTKP